MEEDTCGKQQKITFFIVKEVENTRQKTRT